MTMKQILISTMCALALAVGCGKGPDKKADASPKNKTPSQPKDKPAKPDALQEAAQPLPAPKPSGSSTTSFAAVTKHLDAGGDFYLYWNANQLQSFARDGLKKLEAFIEAEAPTPHEKAEAELLLKLINAAYEESGLSSIDGLGASSFATGNGVRRHKVMIHHDPWKGGGLMWKALGSAPHELGGLKLMPATTAYAIHADLDVAGTFKWLKGFIAGNLPAKQGAMLAELLEEANAEVPIEKIINGTGGEMGMYVTLNPDKMIEVDPFFLGMLGGGDMGTEMPPDPAAGAFPEDGFGNSTFPAPRVPRDFDPSRDDAPPPATKGAPLPDEGPRGVVPPRGFPVPVDPVEEGFGPGKPDMPKIKIPEPGLVLVLKVKGDTIPGLLEQPLADMGAKEQTIDGVTLRTISVPPDVAPFPVSPTLMQVGDYLIFTSTLDLAKQVIAIHGGKAEGLAGTAEFKKLTNGLDLKANMITYTSSQVGDTIGDVLSLVVEDEFRGAPKTVTEMLVELYSVPLKSQVTLLSVTGEGYLIQNQTTGHLPMDPAIATAVAAVPITVAAAASAPTVLPALAKAKAKANRAKSLNNLRQINNALQAYASDHDGKLPPADKWCDAIMREVGHPLVFVSPQDPEARARFERGEKVSSYALNADIAGKNFGEINDFNTVLVFECDLGWNGTGGLADLRKHVPPDQWNIGTIDGASFQANPNVLQRNRIKWKPGNDR